MTKHSEKMIWLSLIAIIYLCLTVSLPIWAQEDLHAVGLWHFNEDGGDAIADSSGNGLNGQQVNCEWTDGKFDSSALRFNQAGSHVEIPYNEALDLQEFTIEFWVKYDTPPGEHVAFMSNRGWQVGDKMTGFTLRDHDINLYLEILTRGSMQTAGGLRVEDWQFITVTYDENRMVGLYMDGELKREQQIAGEILYKGEALWIGAEPGGGYSFGGTGDITIDEVRISNVARSQEEIKLAMEKGYGQLAVYPSLKLSTTWGALKYR